MYFPIVLIFLIFSLFHIRSLLIPYEYVSTESIDYTVFSSLELNAIFLISSVKTLFLLLLNLCRNLKSNFFFIFFKTISINSFLFYVVYYIYNLRRLKTFFIVFKFKFFFLQHTFSYLLLFFLHHYCLNNCRFLDAIQFFS